MPKLTLCCFPGACSRVTMIALEEAGAAYDTHVANLMKGEHLTPGYLAINPKGKVPVLIVDGTPLTENVAILGWIADAYPDAGLLPADALGRAEALSVVSWLASGVLTVMSRIVRPERVTAEEAAVAGIKAMARTDITKSLSLAEAHMAGRSWWLDTWSVADAYLFYIVAAVQSRGVDTAGFPHLLTHTDRMMERPATRRMLDWEARTRSALAI